MGIYYLKGTTLNGTKLFKFNDSFLTITKPEPGLFVDATGGTITTDGDYRIHTFLSTADLTVIAGGDVSALVVGGGGGGGNRYSAGGGAGGYTLTNVTLAETVYTATIGAGGAGGSEPAANRHGKTGANSSFASIDVSGGGGGGEGNSQTAGYVGGSGGGGGTNAAGGAANGAGTGFAGGAGIVGVVSPYSCGGGGGASEVGGDATGNPNGAGGDGGDGCPDLGRPDSWPGDNPGGIYSTISILR